MKRLFLTMMAIVGISASAWAQTVDWNIGYRGEVNVGFATGGRFSFMDVDFKSDISRPFIETVHGVTVTKYAFVGVGAGLQYYYGRALKQMSDEKWNTLSIPIFVNMKGWYPVNDNVRPYISLSLGGSAIATSGLNENELDYDDDMTTASAIKLNGGFYCDFGVGVQLKKFNIGIGLQHQGLALKNTMKIVDYGISSSETIHGKHNSFYVKIGVCF